jgi:hypothetical protein
MQSTCENLSMQPHSVYRALPYHFLFLLWISSLAEKLNHAGVLFQIFAEIV